MSYPTIYAAGDQVNASDVNDALYNPAYTYGETITATTPKAVYLKAADGRIYNAAATSQAQIEAFIGFAVTSGVVNDSNRILGPGKVVTGLSGLTAGAPVYLGNSAGGVSTSPGQFPLQVGVAISSSALVIIRPPSNTPPTGAIVMWPTASAPTGWLLCDGSAVSRTTYAGLFSVISTVYGVGDGSSTFNVPDFRANVAVGYKSADSDFGTLGNTGGEKTHTLSSSEVPTHNHYMSTTAAAGSDSGSVARGNGSGASTMNVSNYGSGGAHNNLQPYLVVNFCIKT